MKAKILSLFFIFLLLIVSIFGVFLDIPNVKALLPDVPYWEDFEDDAVGSLPAEGTWLWSARRYEPSNVFECDGSDLKYGEDPKGDGWLNFSYPANFQVKNINFTYQTFKAFAGISFYHAAFDEISGDHLFTLKSLPVGTNDYWWMYNYTSTAYELIGSKVGVFENRHINLTFYYDNVSMHIQMYQASDFTIFLDMWANKTNGYLNPVFSQSARIIALFIESGAASNGDYMLMRDLKLTFSDTDIGLYDTTGLLQIGNLNADGINVFNWQPYNCPLLASELKYIEIERKVNGNFHIRHFSLAMGYHFFSSAFLDGSIDDIFLQVNGQYVGQPTGLIQISNTRYNVYWANINISVHEYPLFEIKSSIDHADFLNKWDFVVASADVDRDGDMNFQAHNLEQFYDGNYRNWLYSCNYDFVYEFWYSEIAPLVYEEYDYSLIVSPSTVDMYKPISITYTCPIDVINNLVINDSSTDVYNESTLTTGLQTGVYYYYPLTSGIHTIKLWDDTNNEVELSETVTVNDKSYNYVIFTKPNPSKPDKYFDIYYIFNSSTYSGVIHVHDPPFYKFNIPTNVSTLSVIENVKLIELGGYNIYLYMNVTGSRLIKASSVHRVQADYINQLYITYHAVNYYDGDELFITSNDAFIFRGTHNFAGQNVYVSVFNMNFYVGGNPLFSFIMQDGIQYNGDYTAELILEHANTKIILTDIHFIVVDEIEIAVPEWWDIMQNVHPFLKAIVGTIIVLAFTLLPMLIALGFRSKTKIDIPPMVYALSGAIGIVLSIYAGLFDFWVLFFIIAVGIIVTVLFWIRGGGLK